MSNQQAAIIAMPHAGRPELGYVSARMRPDQTVPRAGRSSVPAAR
jgi:hypothetical protein